MILIYQVIGSVMYLPGSRRTPGEILTLRSHKEARGRLLALLQAFVDGSLENVDQGLSTHRSSIVEGFFILNVASELVTVYHASQAELVELGLPVPPEQGDAPC